MDLPQDRAFDIISQSSVPVAPAHCSIGGFPCTDGSALNPSSASAANRTCVLSDTLRTGAVFRSIVRWVRRHGDFCLFLNLENVTALANDPKIDGGHRRTRQPHHRGPLDELRDGLLHKDIRPRSSPMWDSSKAEEVVVAQLRPIQTWCCWPLRHRCGGARVKRHAGIGRVSPSQRRCILVAGDTLLGPTALAESGGLANGVRLPPQKKRCRGFPSSAWMDIHIRKFEAGGMEWWKWQTPDDAAL